MPDMSTDPGKDQKPEPHSHSPGLDPQYPVHGDPEPTPLHQGISRQGGIPLLQPLRKLGSRAPVCMCWGKWDCPLPSSNSEL